MGRESQRTNRVTAIVAERHAIRFFLFARKFLLIAGSDSIARTETQPGRAPSESNRVKKPCRRVCRSRKRVPLLSFFSPFAFAECIFDRILVAKNGQWSRNSSRRYPRARGLITHLS